MKIVLVYDKVSPAGPADDLPEDFGAEYDDASTIRSLLSAIRACGHEAAELVLDADFPREIGRLHPELVFNIAEGVRGPRRESIVPAWLDCLGVPYTGSDGLSLALALDKALTKTLVATQNVRTPRFRLISSLSEAEGLDLAYPLFVKPNAEGSSMGIRFASRVKTPEELERQVAWILSEYRQDCLVEEFAPGREFCVGVLGNEEPMLLPIAEVRYAGEFYAYELKHRHDKELLCPVDVPDDAGIEMGYMALAAFRATHARDFARVDFKLDVAGEPMFLEINPLPGLSPEYGIYPLQARAAGIEYEELIGRIIDMAVRRFDVRKEAMTK